MGKAKGTNLGEVNVIASGRGFLDGIGGQKACFPLQADHLGASTEELRSPALVGLDMRHSVTKNGVIGTAHRCKREGVGRSSIEYKEDRAIGLEEVTKLVTGSLGPIIVPIARGMAMVGFIQNGNYFGTGPGIVVRREISVSGRKVAKNVTRHADREALKKIEEQMDQDGDSDAESEAPSQAGGEEARKKKRERRANRGAARKKIGEVLSKFSAGKPGG